MNIPPDLWKSLLEQVIEDTGGFMEKQGCDLSMLTAGFQLSVVYGRMRPCCLSCKTEFPSVQDQQGEDRWELTCEKCGRRMPVKHPPAWLKKILPRIILILNAEESESCGGWGEPAGKPVVFSCPNCGANLELDGTKRIAECRYCGTGVYLPDDLWLRLHPARTVRSWFVGISPAPKPRKPGKRDKGRDACVEALGISWSRG